ncbi:magnesium chelatase subunit ChlI family protein [Spongiactinospora rosea]|nr:hypothetical protein [Spongiactinospora rosea]
MARLLSRIDVCAKTHPLSQSVHAGEGSSAVARVLAVCERTAERLAGTPWWTNADVPASELHMTYRATSEAIDLLAGHAATGVLTVAAVAPVLRAVWTLADLRRVDRPTAEEAAVALDLRNGGGAPA